MTESQKIELAILVDEANMLKASKLLVEYLGWRPDIVKRVQILINNYKTISPRQDRLEELNTRYGSILN